MIEQCMNCKTLEVEPGQTLCGECYEAGMTFCVYCRGIFQQGIVSPACAAGHRHHWCDDCAAAWAGLCPESDEAQVAKAVMG